MMGRMIIVKLQPNQDVTEALERAIYDAGMTAATVCGAVGSLVEAIIELASVCSYEGGMPEDAHMFVNPRRFKDLNLAAEAGRLGRREVKSVGGHIGYSPVLPAKGDLAMDQFRRTYALYGKYGMDYHASFAFGERSLTNVNQLLFDRDERLHAQFFEKPRLTDAAFSANEPQTAVALQRFL